MIKNFSDSSLLNEIGSEWLRRTLLKFEPRSAVLSLHRRVSSRRTHLSSAYPSPWHHDPVTRHSSVPEDRGHPRVPTSADPSLSTPGLRDCGPGPLLDGESTERVLLQGVTKGPSGRVVSGTDTDPEEKEEFLVQQKPRLDPMSGEDFRGTGPPNLPHPFVRSGSTVTSSVGDDLHVISFLRIP